MLELICLSGTLIVLLCSVGVYGHYLLRQLEKEDGFEFPKS